MVKSIAWVRLAAAVIIAPLSVFPVFPALIAGSGMLLTGHDFEWSEIFLFTAEIVLFVYLSMLIGLPIYLGIARSVPRFPIWIAIGIGLITSLAAQTLVFGRPLADISNLAIFLVLGAVVGSVFWLIARPDIYVTRTAISAS